MITRFLLFWHSICVQLVSADAAVTPTSIHHLPFLSKLFVSPLLRHCLIKPPCNCWEKCIHTDRSRVPRLCFPFLLSSPGVAACRSKMRDLSGQDCMPISDWISSCLLSVISRVLEKSSGSAAWVFVCHPDKTDRKPQFIPPLTGSS